MCTNKQSNAFMLQNWFKLDINIIIFIFFNVFKWNTLCFWACNNYVIVVYFLMELLSHSYEVAYFFLTVLKSNIYYWTYVFDHHHHRESVTNQVCCFHSIFIFYCLIFFVWIRRCITVKKKLHVVKCHIWQVPHSM